VVERLMGRMEKMGSLVVMGRIETLKDVVVGLYCGGGA
jgi:hypothetical protein